MRHYRVELYCGWRPRERTVRVCAPNMDCAFWVALYEVDPGDEQGYHERAIARVPD